jgi:hypothetical protein
MVLHKTTEQAAKLQSRLFFDPNGIRVEVTKEHQGAAGDLPTIGGCGHHHG